MKNYFIANGEMLNTDMSIEEIESRVQESLDDKSTFCDTTLLEVVQDDAVIPTKNRNVIIILFIELLFRFYMQIISFLY